MALSDTAALVSSLELQDKFSKTAEKYERSLGAMERRTSTFGSVMRDAQAGLGTFAHNLRSLATVGAGLAVAGLTLSIRAASDLEESMSKVEVVFAENADEVKTWADTAATAFGQSRQQALESAGTFGNLFQAFGIGLEPATEMSQSLVELAADLASFNNTSVDDALLALRSGLSGETEPLKRFGVAINDARLRDAALRLGLIKTVKTALTPAQKAQAAYALILEDTALAQGDFARTSDGLANQQRILRANLQNTAATIGTALLPSISEVITKVNDLVTENQPQIMAFAAELPEIFDQVMSIVGNLPWDAIGDAFELMGTGSRALLDAFTGMPDWVQTAVLTGWGLNKITGGMLTDIFGTLASGLIKGILGINAAVVNINAATVNGPGGPGVPGGGGKGPPLLAPLGAAGLALTAGEVLRGGGELTPEIQVIKLLAALKQGGPTIEAGDTAGITREAIRTLLSDPEMVRQLRGNQEQQLREMVGVHRVSADQLRAAHDTRRDRQREAEQTRQQLENLANLERRQEQQGQTTISSLERLNAKNFAPVVKVSVTSNVTISEIQRKITSQQIAIGKGPLEFE